MESSVTQVFLMLAGLSTLFFMACAVLCIKKSSHTTLILNLLMLNIDIKITKIFYPFFVYTK